LARPGGVLTDVERLASCLPGARLAIDGDECLEHLRIKVGAVGEQCQGSCWLTHWLSGLEIAISDSKSNYKPKRMTRQ
jgi:hypothetical protein